MYYDFIMTLSFMQTLRNAIEMKEAQYSSVAATLTSEGVTLRAELQSASEAQDLVQSELTAATSDLVTAHSQANTHRMAAEQVGQCWLRWLLLA